MATATPIDKNQYDYLTGLTKTGSAGNQAWAKSQLANSTYTPVAAATATPVTSKPPSAYDWSNNNTNEIPKSGGGGGTPAPVKPVLPQAQQQVTNSTATPVAAQQTATQQGSYPGQLTTAQIQAEAQARIDKQRAALMNAVTGAKTGAKNTYDYTQGLQKDNRVLEDAQFQRNNNPFSGGTDYKTAMVNRDRQIADTASSKDYNNTIAGYDAQVASFDTLAPGQQQAAIDELTRIERQYGLDLGALTGNINGGQTLAAKTAEQNYQLGLSGLSGQLPASAGGGQTIQGQTAALNNQGQALTNQLTQLKLNDYPAESKASAQLVQQQLTSGQISNDTAQFKLNELKDPNSPTNQAAKLDLQMKQIDASSYSQENKLKIQQLQKQIAQIGAAPYKSADEKAYDAQQVIKIKAEIEKLNHPASAAPKTTDYKLNPKFSEDIAYIKANPNAASMLDTNAQQFIDAYGYDGYKEMRLAAGLTN